MNEEHEFEHATGDSVVVLPLAKESEEELTLLVLPSRISEDKLGKRKGNHILSYAESQTALQVCVPVSKEVKFLLPLQISKIADSSKRYTIPPPAVIIIHLFANGRVFSLHFTLEQEANREDLDSQSWRML